MPLPMFTNQQAEVKQSPLNGISKVIAVAAGKGGVGKSLITAYIALSLKQQGYRVGILDSDLYGPSMRNILPEDRMPAQKGDRLIPALTHGMPMLSMAYFRKKTEAVGVRAPIANKLIRHFIEEVDWGNLDYLLIDFPPGTGDIQITLGQHLHIDAALLITTPQEISVLDVRKAASLFQQLQIPIAGIVENMSYYREKGTGEKVELFGSGGGERLAIDLQVPILGKIPLDPELGKAADAGRSPFLKDPETFSETLQELLSVARKLVSQTNEPSIKAMQPQELYLEWRTLP